MSTNVKKVISKLRPGQAYDASNVDELVIAILGKCRGDCEEMLEAEKKIRQEHRKGHFPNRGIGKMVYRPDQVVGHSKWPPKSYRRPRQRLDKRDPSLIAA